MNVSIHNIHLQLIMNLCTGLFSQPCSETVVYSYLLMYNDVENSISLFGGKSVLVLTRNCKPSLLLTCVYVRKM